MRFLLMLSLCALCAPVLLSQSCASANANPAVADWFVDATATNPSAQGTKSDPFPTIGGAFNVADDNDRIFVAAGTYDAAAGETFPYQWGANAALSQLGIQIIGVSGAANTIVDGGGLSSGFGIMRFRLLAAGASIRGFTFRGYGGTLGAIRLGSTSGGFEAHDVEISHCIFEGSAGSGIATFGASSALKIHDNLFLNNLDNGLWCSDITSNTNPCAMGSSGGEVYNNTFVGNGNGIRLQGGVWDVYNNIVVNSTVNGIFDFGLAGFPAAVGSYTLDFNCLFGNGVAYGGGLVAGPGGIAADPMFVNAAANDFHLSASSPCIDAGRFILPPYMASDMDGDPRQLPGSSGTLRSDMGADEYTDVSHVVSAASLGFPVAQFDVNGPPGDSVLRGFSLGQGNLVIAEGHFLLDLASLTILDPVPVPIPAGGTLILPVGLSGLPPSAIGTPVYSQAVVFGAAGGRLTNSWTTIICP